MSTLAEVLARWVSRRAEFARFGIVVGERIAAEIIADLEQLGNAAAAELLTPGQAAARSGYHVESLLRLARTGKLENHGTVRRPLFRASELPHKPKKGDAVPLARTVTDRLGSARRDARSIARDALAGRIGRRQ